ILIMSALPPKADIGTQPEMSALCHFRTYPTAEGSLLDHLVGATDQRDGDFETERFSGLQVDVQLDFRGLLYWQVGGHVALENPAGIIACQAICLSKVRSVAQQTSGRGKLATLVDRWHRVTEPQRGEQV